MSEREATPSSRLARFIHQLSFDALPNKATRLIERSFLDTIGVTLAGLEEGAGEISANVLGSDCSGCKASVLGHDETVSQGDAAFVNGTAGHGLDFDDSTSAINGHPSVTMVPALLAVAESESSLSGADLITAYAAGFETQCYLAAPILDTHYERGWHATSTFGTFGAAASVAHLLKLPKTDIEHCLNTAASLPAGIKGNFGSMAKPMHAGHAARSGVTATLLAANGFTAGPSAIDTTYGFFDLYGGAGSPDRDEWFTLGDKWGLLEHGIDLKKYPCCYFTHAAASGAITLATDHNLNRANINEIEIQISQGAAETASVGHPESGLEAKFSFPYIISRAIQDKGLTLETFEDESVREHVDTIGSLISINVNEDIYHNALSAKVSVSTKDGVTYETYVKYPPGRHEAPLTETELREKFEMCASRSLADGPTTELWEQLTDLRNLSDTSTLFEHL